MTLLLTESDVESVLDFPSVIESVEQAFRQQAGGLATNHARRRVMTPSSGLNVMFAGAPEMGSMGLKAYSISRSGARFYVMLFDASTGELLAIVQADRLGQMRTGAASAVATRYLARPDARTLGIYGAGWQAEAQLEAIACVRDLERVVVYSRTGESRRAFAERMSERTGLEVEPVSSAEEPAAQDIVVTITSSREPVLRGEWLSPGSHVNAAGSNFLYKSEIDRDTVRRSSLVCIDSREEIGLEAGSLLPSLDTGVLFPEAVHELSEVVAGRIRGRRGPEDVTLFVSQGIALEDVATARLVYDRALEQNLGRDVDL
ncbi:ornithine cyclodeaminase family protein [Rubrobacter calidifluminis]|uniref:ornithine cyclodeaminase family protein n=1 Tax=Rubrobacter calidifluminis TaxID=1392640 RepID=UPI0023613219|nr:ornithine cyclodeaminase family protein [Rubrobacter calidifluminis]